MIVVEGESDESLLKSLFPVEVAKAVFVVAGDVHGVMKVCEGLSKVEQVIPFICVRDRDFLSAEERDSLCAKFPNLHIWGRRMIENELLDKRLIEEMFRRAGKQVSSNDISILVASLLDEGDKSEVVLTMLDERLGKVKPVDPMPEVPKGIERKRASYAHLAKAADARVQRFDDIHAQVVADVEGQWSTDWVTLVEGKNLVGRLTQRSPVKDVKAALAAAFVAEESVRPEGLNSLGARLKELSSLSGKSNKAA